MISSIKHILNFRFNKKFLNPEWYKDTPVNFSDYKKMTPRQNWSICYDGTIEPRAVKGAVNDFASSVNKDVFVTNDKWPSWSIFK